MEALDASGRPLHCCGEDGAALEAAGDAHGVLVCPIAATAPTYRGVECWTRLRRRPSPVGPEGRSSCLEGAALRCRRTAHSRRRRTHARRFRLRPARGGRRRHRWCPRAGLFVSSSPTGGMWADMVDVGWWRDKGVPLLTERALARRTRQTVDPGSGSFAGAKPKGCWPPS